MSGSENSKSCDYYKKKYLPMESMCVFQDCRIYFYEMPIVNKDLKIVSELALRRMRLEITMRGGEVCENLLRATHLVAYSIFGSHNFDELYKSFPSGQRQNLHHKRLHVVMHQWLDDSLEKGVKLLEDAYNLKPDTLEELKLEESKADIQVPHTISRIEKQKILKPLDTSEKRKRGRPARANTKGRRPAPKPYRRTRARIGNRAATINSDELESGDSINESDGKEAEEPMEEAHVDLEKHESSEDNKEPRNGRPARTNTKRGRTAPKPYQATRARIGNHAAKINSDELESGDSIDETDGKEAEELMAETHFDLEKHESSKDDKQPRRGRPAWASTKQGKAAPKPYQRTRARIGKRAAKINSDELVNSDSVDEFDSKEADEPMQVTHFDLERHENCKDNKAPIRATVADDPERTCNPNLVEADTKLTSKGSEIVSVSEIGKKGIGEQPEQMVDPLHAMMLDMIPTLSQKREAPSSSVVSVAGEEKSEPDPDANPVKKKKVSYKDVASDLLNGW